LAVLSLNCGADVPPGPPDLPQQVAAERRELKAWRTVAEWLRRGRSRSISTRGVVFTATRGEWLNFDGWDAEWTIITVASKPGIVSLAAALEQKEPT